MKKYIFLAVFTVFTSLTIAAQEINWITLEEAVELQKKNPKKIMMDMYTSWCGPCKMLDRNTFANKDVAAYVNKHYYAVKFNAEGNDNVTFKGKAFGNPNYDPAKAKRRNSGHELARYFNIRSYPTIVFLDEKADFIAPIIGYKKPQQLELYLKMFKKDEHVDMDTQEKFNAYFKKFEPTFSQI
ncbi:thioredoxin fold domain-containing protein [Lacinutrix sp. MedPE-SW]|uniref:thioredoxin family protein n=1 Tax=Lacinutrix sp. MedPE-SW TaxID=1860087 RepID=UPI000922FE59|nr:thioredoxin fold domain-containing protein [Lacinutrix sp. MedPE-SW]OIQ18211.1 MAG: thioredoxin family protein [Lacinutrix sp. MedPE-SW]